MTAFEDRSYYAAIRAAAAAIAADSPDRPLAELIAAFCKERGGDDALAEACDTRRYRAVAAVHKMTNNSSVQLYARIARAEARTVAGLAAKRAVFRLVRDAARLAGIPRQRIRLRKKQRRQRLVARIADRVASGEPAIETARYVLQLMSQEPRTANAQSYFNICPDNVRREIKRLFASTVAGQALLAEAMRRTSRPRLH